MDSRPRLIISALDAERLESLLETLPRDGSSSHEALEAELLRADIVDSGDMPPTVVTMNSTVRFEVESPPEEFQLTLVYPKDLDASDDKLSVLAPTGSALLGLSEGDTIEWPRLAGGHLRVRVKELIFQPERAGELHR